MQVSVNGDSFISCVSSLAPQVSCGVSCVFLLWVWRVLSVWASVGDSDGALFLNENAR